MEQLLRRYARTHGPFTTAEPARRFGLRAAQLEPVLRLLESQGSLVQGEIRPSGTGPEWCDAEVMRQLRRRTLARARDQVAPVDGATLGRFLPAWHGIGEGRRGPERLLEALIQLEGLSLSWRQLDRVLLPARVPGYRSEDLDLLAASGQIIWVGRGAAGPKDGRIALYRPEQAALVLDLSRAEIGQSQATSPVGDVALAKAAASASASALEPPAAIAELILKHLSRRGACFLFELQQVTQRARLTQGSKSDQDTFETALWDLVWAGRITNDTFAPLRSLDSRRSKTSRARRRGHFRAGAMAGNNAFGGGLAGGRWSLVKDLAGVDVWFSDRVATASAVGLDLSPSEEEDASPVSGKNAAAAATEATERLLAQARMLLERYGVLSREAVAAEDLPGGFGPLYKVLKQMEEVGQVRRGYFIEGLSGAQFALPAAIERLRAARLDEPPLDGFDPADVRILAAIDPANPYGALLPWPEVADAGLRLPDLSPSSGREPASSKAGSADTGSGAGQSNKAASRSDLKSGQSSPKRTAGAWVILVAGKPIVYVAASGKQILTFPDVVSDEGNELELALSALLRVPSAGRKRLLIQHIDGLPALESPLREALLAAGFEADYDALAPARFASDATNRRGTGRDPNAISCAGPRGSVPSRSR